MPQPTIVLDGRSLTVPDVVRVAREAVPVALDPKALAGLAETRAVVEQAIARGDVLYGVNTGFGKLANVRIDPARLAELQLNLIRSHAAGVGDPFPAELVRAMLLLRANVLLRPTSGVRPELVEAVIALLNAGIVPWVPEQGSVGASGDLAPLAHLALSLIGEGFVLADAGSRRPAEPALAAAGLAAFQLAPKEGLAFINGTQGQTAILALLVYDAEVLWRTGIGAAAMSLEALRGTPTPLDPRIHEQRPHEGQLRAAALLRELLAGSEIRESHRENDPRVQDAYSLRCAPQVLGAVGDGITYARRVLEVELNSSTDNPLVFVAEGGRGGQGGRSGQGGRAVGEVLSGGNFHGQPVAQALDFLAIALVTLQALAERRVERLVNPDLSQGLPAFLTADAGLASGYMMVQITAASLVAESRALAYPASIGSIPTDANQEDFVPMGMAAAYKARRILSNAQRVVAAELLAGAQGLEFLRPLRPGRGVEALYHKLRASPGGVQPLLADRPPGLDLEQVAGMVRRGELDPDELGGRGQGAGDRGSAER